MRRRPSSSKGTVSLVALCFIAVLGIVLASYIAVCSRAMNLSNRSYQASLGQQLAEFGLEEAIRALNKGDSSNWTNSPAGVSASAWSFDTTNKRATRTITFAAGKLAQGATATVKIRIDNYDSGLLDSAWNSATNYRVDNLVSYTDGNWYRCVAPNLNQIPSTGSLYWTLEQGTLAASINWAAGVDYIAGSMVLQNGSWYRSTSVHTSTTANKPPGGSWTSVPYVSADADLHYNNESILNYYGTWYRYNNGWEVNPTLSWRWRTGLTYNPGDVVWYNNGWYRCRTTHNSSSYNPTNTTYWSTAQGLYATAGSTGWAWSSSERYNQNDVVYRSGSWYRCIRGNINQVPPNALYWSTSPVYSTAWNSNRQYSANDTVRYNGVWYLSIQNSNVAQNPSTATTYWIGANTTTASYLWNSTTSYSVGALRSYGGVWYRCSTANSGQPPNNTSYWSATWTNSAAVTTGAPVVYAEANISLPGNPASKTQLRAVVHPASLFPNAIGATDTISLGSAGTIDSYDSITDLTAATRGYSAIVSSSYTASTAVTIFSTTVQGYVAAPSATTSPYAPLASFGSNAVIKGTSATPSPKADTSRITRSPYVPVFDPLPNGGLATNWSSVPKGVALTISTTINIGTPGATTPARYYYNGDLTVGTSTLTTININGPVILYINGNLTITASGSTGRINVNSAGSAEIHISGGLKADVNGEGIYNQTLDPKKLTVICDSSGTTTQFYSDGSYPFYGTLYVPNTTSSTGFFNDNSSVQIYGAISAKMVTFSGANANVHYDTSLRYASIPGVDQPYTITEWRKLPITEQATMP